MASGLEHARDQLRRGEGKTDRAQQDKLNEEKVKAITPSEWPAYFRMLAICLNSGVSITNALDALCESKETSKDLKALTARILERLERGWKPEKAFEVLALQKPFQYEMIKVGLRTGALDRVLTYVGDFSEREYKTALEIRSRLVYPFTVVGLILVAGFVISAAIGNNIEGSLEALNITPPFALSLLLQLYDAFEWYIVGPIFLLVYLMRRALFKGLSWKSVRNLCFRALHRFPVLKSLMMEVGRERFLRAYSLQNRVGLDPVGSILNALDSTVDPLFIGQKGSIAKGIRDGQEVPEALEKSGLFDATTIGMIRTGMESGKLDHLLEVSADMIKLNLDRRLEQVLSLLEPLVLAGLGLLVGSICFVMFRGITQLTVAL